jgi:sulfatase maturation enzyme AslB (radical SAM superfamily)
MCSNHSSSKWNKEQRILSQKLNFVNYSEISNDWTKSQSVTDFIDSHVSTLKDLRFAGGEPTYQSMPIKIMKRLIDIGVSKDIDLKLNVNLTHITEDAINTWSKFRSVRIMASLDGVRELNTYIRYPGDWNTVINNLQILTALNHEKQLDLQVLSTIQVYNAFDMLNIEELMSNLRIKEKHAFTPVWNPSYLNVQCIPEQLKEKILLRYPNPSSQVKKILDFMMYQQLNNWEQFKQFTLAVDSNRNQNVLDFVPELKGYL